MGLELKKIYKDDRNPSIIHLYFTDSDFGYPAAILTLKQHASYIFDFTLKDIEEDVNSISNNPITVAELTYDLEAEYDENVFKKFAYFNRKTKETLHTLAKIRLGNSENVLTFNWVVSYLPLDDRDWPDYPVEICHDLFIFTHDTYPRIYQTWLHCPVNKMYPINGEEDVNFLKALFMLGGSSDPEIEMCMTYLYQISSKELIVFENKKLHQIVAELEDNVASLQTQVDRLLK